MFSWAFWQCLTKHFTSIIFTLLTSFSFKNINAHSFYDSLIFSWRQTKAPVLCHIPYSPSTTVSNPLSVEWLRCNCSIQHFFTSQHDIIHQKNRQQRKAKTWLKCELLPLPHSHLLKTAQFMQIMKMYWHYKRNYTYPWNSSSLPFFFITPSIFWSQSPYSAMPIFSFIVHILWKPTLGTFCLNQVTASSVLCEDRAHRKKELDFGSADGEFCALIFVQNHTREWLGGMQKPQPSNSMEIPISSGWNEFTAEMIFQICTTNQLNQCRFSQGW